MEFNFSIQRLLLLFACLAIFAMAGGFTAPSLATDSMLDPHRVAKAWRYCVLLFISGALSASVVDHFVGNIDRCNIRLIYIILGAALMIGSCIWIKGLQGAALSEPNEVNVSNRIQLFVTNGKPQVPAMAWRSNGDRMVCAKCCGTPTGPLVRSDHRFKS